MGAHAAEPKSSQEEAHDVVQKPQRHSRTPAHSELSAQLSSSAPSVEVTGSEGQPTRRTNTTRQRIGASYTAYDNPAPPNLGKISNRGLVLEDAFWDVDDVTRAQWHVWLTSTRYLIHEHPEACRLAIDQSGERGVIAVREWRKATRLANRLNHT